MDVRDATHVKLKDGTIERIKEKWGIDPNGELAPPSEGGFGVITESGKRVTMWDAYAYLGSDDVDLLAKEIVADLEDAGLIAPGRDGILAMNLLRTKLNQFLRP